MTLKILTVDDSKTIRTIVKRAFAPYDCEVFEAENGVEGLAAAAKLKPDLIVLDLTMPVMTGVEMLEKLKADQTLKTIPVIMLTAESGRENVLRIVKLGVNDYIVKPFKGEQLIQRAEKIVKLEPKKEDKSDELLQRYISQKDNFYILTLPDKITKVVMVELENVLHKTMEGMAKSGNCILNLQNVVDINVSLVKAILLVLEECQKNKVKVKLVGSSQMSQELKGFSELGGIAVYPSFEEAMK
jgi:CheY-like chemotaxis protein